MNAVFKILFYLRKIYKPYFYTHKTMINNTSAIGKGINTLDTLLSGIFTEIVIAIIILLMGFIIGKILGRLLQKVLHEFQTDKVLKNAAGIHFSIEHLIGSLLTYFILYSSNFSSY